MKKIIAVVGATASGKTALSIELAKHFNTEIVSCDSMQVYKGMDIGTAKPSLSEREGIVHHMFDVCTPDQHFDAGMYAKCAKKCCDDILVKGKIPIVCGGTGLYLKALTHGIADIPNCPQLDHGADCYNRLCQVDQVTAAKFLPSDIRRINRALDVFVHTGKPISYFHALQPEPVFDPICVGIAYPDRKILHKRIEKRVDIMREQALIDEVRKLYSMYTEKCNNLPTAFQAIGYKEIIQYFNGECSEKQAFEQIVINTRQYAKRQMTWFNNQNKVFWSDYIEEELEKIFENIINFVEKMCDV